MSIYLKYKQKYLLLVLLLKRLVGRTLEVDLSRLLIEGAIKEHDTVIIDYQNNQFTIEKKI